MTRPASHVAILMCTFNGARFLHEQLQSIAAQQHTGWTLHVSDDGSTDGTLELLREVQAEWGADRLVIHAGPRRGYARNFLSLLQNRAIDADYFALCDQDDLWLTDKLSRAVAQLPDPSVKGLYCSSSCLIDEQDHVIGQSYVFTRPPSFANALCENIAGGNTMVLTRAACDALRQVDPQREIPYHDWWCYVAVSACGGDVIYDKTPSIRYRQHDANQIGTGKPLLARLQWLRRQYGGEIRRWNDCHIAALQDLTAHMPARNRRILQQFAEARQKRLWQRLAGMKASTIYRQTIMGTMSLMLATLLKRI